MSTYTIKDFAFMLAGGYSLRPYMTGAITLNANVATTVDDTPAGSEYTIKKYAGEIANELAFDVTYDDALGAENDFLFNVTTGKFKGACQVAYGIEGNTAGKKFVGLPSLNVIGTARNPKKGDIHRGNIAFDNASQYGPEEGKILVPLSVLVAATDSASVDAGIVIATSSVANPTLITTSDPHGLKTGDTVIIESHAGSTPVINGSRVVTVLSADTFTIPVNVTADGTGGTVTPANGGAVHLQVPACTLGGYTNWLIKLQDSEDNATWVDVATAASQAVTAASIPIAYRIAVSGAIRRYSRLNITLVGAGSAPSLTLMGGLIRF